MPTTAVERILNFRQVSDQIGTAGQPTANQFADIKAAGYDVVINLAMPDSSNAIPDEADLVASHGMEYLHIPVVWEEPTLQDLSRFLEAMERYQGSRIFVHCALNWRVSAFVFLGQVIEQAVDYQRARLALEQVWQPNATWEDFIARALAEHGIRESRGG
jgi:protein tyrosine phosphatase (PTP) superfamily phosphohydrolase (DUF442 family)